VQFFHLANSQKASSNSDNVFLYDFEMFTAESSVLSFLHAAFLAQ